jgi:hypothetical protein
MRKTRAHTPLPWKLTVALGVLSSACTGVSSLPTGSTGAGSGTPSPTGPGAGGGASNGVGAGKMVVPGPLDPGRVVLRRLNIAEYNNTVRDLLGTTAKPADKFPADNVTDGFDTVGTVLSFSDLLLEQAETAAGALVDELMARPRADPLRTRILACEPTTANLQTCLPQILTPFMKNAYRRPATAAEVQDLVLLGSTITQSSADVTRGVSAALKAVLLSPHFLFHVETGAPTVATATPLNDYELANRISYFLWSSMPDQTLMQAADGGKLSPGGTGLTAEVDRVAADPKAQAFVDNFGGQWLSTREIDGVAPDAMQYKTFDESLRSSMGQETALFFQSLLKDAQPLTALLLADFTFVNDRLARHYGIPAGQTAFARVSLKGSPRLGLLTQETFLTVTSNPDRTSPVKRGNWVLEHLLCDPPPVPPPGVPPLATPMSGSGLTVRAVLEEHRKNPNCAVCHKIMDPIGLALENFDAIGAYRTMDNGQAIDASGTMSDGTTFKGASELAQLLAKDPRYARCIVKQTLTYAVGRSFDTPEGNSYVATVAAPLAKNGTWPDVLRSIATSQAFLTRRGEAP